MRGGRPALPADPGHSRGHPGKDCQEQAAPPLPDARARCLGTPVMRSDGGVCRPQVGPVVGVLETVRDGGRGEWIVIEATFSCLPPRKGEEMLSFSSQPWPGHHWLHGSHHFCQEQLSLGTRNKTMGVGFWRGSSPQARSAEALLFLAVPLSNSNQITPWQAVRNVT